MLLSKNELLYKLPEQIYYVKQCITVYQCEIMLLLSRGVMPWFRKDCFKGKFGKFSMKWKFKEIINSLKVLVPQNRFSFW